MIENIRKYTGLMIVVLVLLFIGLVFLGDTARNSVTGKPVMEVNGVAISQKEFRRLASNALEIPNSFAGSGPLSPP
ncbi:SurA N-terminal domain-containing protein, partial [Akkermansiaceae bacterium]|nr:SurA N-terminal domain-containing protein [Akkermansiaceae bacterium]